MAASASRLVAIVGDPPAARRSLGAVLAGTVLPDEVVLVPGGDADPTTGAEALELLAIAAKPLERPLVRIASKVPPGAAVIEAGDVWFPNHLERLDAASGAAPGYRRSSGGALATIGSDVQREPTWMRCPSGPGDSELPGSDPSAAPLPVSVIVPAYRCGAMLGASLGSVLAQTAAPAEVVVIDDGSGDDTGDVAARWADLLPLTLVRKLVNEGLGAARLDAIAASSQPLVALLDADDYWLPDHLELMHAAYRGEGSLVTGRPLRWRPEDDEGGPHRAMGHPIPPLARQRASILAGNFLFICTLFDRATYDRAGGFAPRRRLEDWDLWMRMIAAGAEVTTTDAPSVLYRRHSASLSGGDRGLLEFDIEFLDQLSNELTGAERRIVRRAARGRRALLDLADGRAAAACGDLWSARRAFAKAAVRDHSIRPTAPPSGSATVRGCVGVISPRRLVDAASR